MWMWGWIAALLLWLRGDAPTRLSAMRAALWIAVALLPYCFLTYSTAIPSRQTYLPTVGLCLLFGLAIQTLAARQAIAVFAALMLVHNVGYLWIRKRTQFLERAAPTEQLIQMARQTDGPIWVRCFPRTDWIAREAVHLAAGKPDSILVWSESEARASGAVAEFCFRDR
jgi:hypothetical protein